MEEKNTVDCICQREMQVAKTPQCSGTVLTRVESGESGSRAEVSRDTKNRRTSLDWVLRKNFLE